MIDVYASIDQVRMTQLIQGLEIVRGSILQRVGYRGKQILIRDLLRGANAEVNMFRPERMEGRTETRDRTGKRLFSYTLNSAKDITRIKSYPLNLFEHGRHFKSGYVDPPKYILRLKLAAKLDPMVKGIMHQRISEYVRKYGRV